MNQIETQMTRLKLHGMAKAWTALKEARKNQSLSLTEGLELLLQSEELEKDNRRFKRLEHTAQFRYKASLEELKLDRTVSPRATPYFLSDFEPVGLLQKQTYEKSESTRNGSDGSFLQIEWSYPT